MQDRLYHYTTVANFMNMVRGKELWLTEYQFLNDREEYTFFTKFILNALESIDIEAYRDRFNGRADVKILKQQFDDWMQNFKNGRVGPSFDTPIGSMIYLLSLSKDGDSLAQWRAYGNGELCIEFRTQYLKTNISTENELHSAPWLKEVDYHGKTPSPDMISAIRAMLDAAVSKALDTGSVSQFYLQGTQWETHGAIAPLSLKHEGFRSEAEVRMVVRKPGDMLQIDRMRASGKYLVPYLPLKFEPEKAISAIIFGPGADSQIVTAFTRLARDSRFLRTWEIRHSEIPYRT